MNFYKIFFGLFIFFFINLNYSCKSKTEISATKPMVSSLKVDESKTLTRIALGSCNRSDYEQPLWQPIVDKKPDLWIWLGDNIYGDTEDMKALAANYALQKNNSEYQKLMTSTPIIGIWDDHDYGVNDGGKEYPKRSESRDVMLDFLDVPKSNLVWQREGGYQSYSFGKAGKKVKVLLLDARYFRDRVERRRKEYPQYIPNLTGTILGEKQWKWLEEELRNSDAQIHIFGSGIQVLPVQHNFEKWNTFPQERDRLFNLIVKHQVPGAIFISGDRHMGEISKKEIEGLEYPLVELTSSGLTHTYERASEENSLRIGKFTDQLNFGFIEIDWNGNKPAVELEIRGEEGKLFQAYNIDYNQK